MIVQSAHALKEWNAQVQVLLQGQHALLIRKGGIIEKNLEFEIEHRDFYLYPTHLHQNKLELKPQHHPLLSEAPHADQVQFAGFAEVRAVWKIEDLDVALQLEDLQALNHKAIERRFHYRNRPYLHALLLKTSRLQEPFSLLETPEMLGCVSWVPLGLEKQAEAFPVWNEQQLADLQARLQALLGPPLALG